MAPASDRPEAPRARLSADRIVQLAVSIADQEGLGAVSMRRLAREQAVTPMALYWHFADKEQLLDAMVEHAIADAEFTDAPEAAWEERYRGVLTRLVTLLRTHPWMGRPIIERLVPLPKHLAALEILLDSARVAGLTPRIGTMVAQQAVQNVVAMAEDAPKNSIESRTTPASRAELAELLNGLDPVRFPNIRAAIEPLTTPDNLKDYYRLGVDMIIGGIRAITESHAVT